MTLRSKNANVPTPNQSQQDINNAQNRLFYEQFIKVNKTGYLLSVQVKQILGIKDEQYKKLINFEKKAQQQFKDKIRKEAPEKKKRNRRTADEIQKNHACQIERCRRSYGSEGSLIQHIKIKHPQLYAQMLSNNQFKNVSLSDNREEEENYYESYES